MLPCRLCECERCDSQQYYVVCPVLWACMGNQFSMRCRPKDAEATAWFLREVGRSGLQSIRAVVIVDAALHAVASKRNGSRQSPVAFLDARPGAGIAR